MASNTTPAPLKLAGALHRRLYRVGVGRKMFGLPVLILKTKGRKSGKEIRTPLIYLEDGQGMFLIASKGGSDSHPGWYHNLVAQPEVSAQVGADEQQFRAEPVADRQERDRLYALAASKYKGYADYEKKTDRLIPVVRLHKRA